MACHWHSTDMPSSRDKVSILTIVSQCCLSLNEYYKYKIFHGNLILEKFIHHNVKMTPFRSPGMDQRANIDEDNPHSQFYDHPDLHGRICPGAVVREGTEQPDVLQVLHV